MYGYDIETKAQSPQWKRQKKACQVRSKVKALLSVFFDCNGVVWCSCHKIVRSIRNTTLKLCPKLLNFEQKQRHMDIVQEMLAKFNDDPDLLKKVIKGHISWVYMTLKSKPNHHILLRLRRGCWWCWRVVRLMPINFNGCFRLETCASEDCSKIAKF